MAKVAFLGLGVMGFPMAGHLKNKGGHQVTVYNRNAAKADKWVAQYGGKKAATPKEAASGQETVGFGRCGGGKGAGDAECEAVLFDQCAQFVQLVAV